MKKYVNPSGRGSGRHAMIGADATANPAAVHRSDERAADTYTMQIEEATSSVYRIASPSNPAILHK